MELVVDLIFLVISPASFFLLTLLSKPLFHISIHSIPMTITPSSEVIVDLSKAMVVLLSSLMVTGF